MSLSWSQSSTDYSISGTSPATLTKSTGTNWTNYCYTASTFGNFTADNIVASSDTIAIGVTDPAQLQSGDKDESSLRYGLYRKGGPEWRVVVNGSGIPSTDTSGTTGKIVFDGTDVKFYVDNVEIHSHTATVTSGLYGYGAVYYSGEDVTIALTATVTPSGDTLLFPPPVAYI